ncbi:MAG: ABC transporter permease [Woeseiaceae bacterium]|nr:ABC transporter permease [Woeseiaceae bacterium]
MTITLRLAWRNLWRHSRRSWLTVGAMVFSNILLVFLISLQFGMYELMIENTLRAFTGHLQIQAVGYKDDQKMRQVVPDAGELAQRLRQELGTEHISARGIAFVLVSSEDRTYGIQLVGADPAFEPGVSSLPGLIRDGRYLNNNTAAEIVIGSVLARNLRVGLGDELTVLGSGRDGSFAATVANIVGIFDSGVPEFDRNIAEVPLDFFQDAFYMQGAAHEIVLVADSLAQLPEFKAKVTGYMPTDPTLALYDWDELQPGLKQAIQADISSAFFMYAILVILVAFSVLNTQLMSVLERTREFGIIMALGVTPGRLGRLVLLETVLMGAIGMFAGAFLGVLVTLWFSTHGFSYPGMEEMAATFNLPARFYPQATWLSTFGGPLVVFVFSIAAALYPALRMHWLQPVAAMRAA